MITRDFRNGGYSAGCSGAPPPLHVYDHESEYANWHPLERIEIRPQPDGPEMIRIPVVAPWGDDPTNPAHQTEPRASMPGMISYLNHGASGGQP